MIAERGAGRVPLYQQVKQALTEAVARGDYSPGKPFITERKVCEQFGVSTTTAVKALNELVAEGVLVRRQGSGTFVADRRTTDLPAGHPNGDPPSSNVGSREPTIACILQGHGPHLTQLLRGVEATSGELGYRLFLTHCDDLPDREGAALRAALASQVSGIILYPAEGSANVEVFAEVRHRGVPLVMVDRYRLDMPTDAVVADNVAVGYEVTQHLIQLGHRSIATLWDEIDCTSVRDRLSGHLQALRKNDIAIRPDLTVLQSYSAEAGGATRSGRIAKLLASPEPPTVLLCANGFTLAHAVHDLAALGAAATSTVDLAGMDDAGPYDILPLTAVAAELPSWEIGAEAMKLLHERVVSADPYRDVQRKVLPISIKTRASAPGYLRVMAAE